MTQNRTQTNSCIYLATSPKLKDVPPQNKRAAFSAYAQEVLHAAYKLHFGEDLANHNLRRLPSGKCVCDLHFFSVSHSGNWVAVALSTRPVGVDLQEMTDLPTEKCESLAQRFFTDGELASFMQSTYKKETFFRIWCQKESMWKMLDEQPSTVRSVDTSNGKFFVQKTTLDGTNFMLVATDPNATVQILK